MYSCKYYPDAHRDKNDFCSS